MNIPVEGMNANSGLDQTVVLATGDDTLPLMVPEGVYFLSLIEGTIPDKAHMSSAAYPRGARDGTAIWGWAYRVGTMSRLTVSH
jgi:hypothetical protein